MANIMTYHKKVTGCQRKRGNPLGSQRKNNSSPGKGGEIASTNAERQAALPIIFSGTENMVWNFIPSQIILNMEELREYCSQETLLRNLLEEKLQSIHI